jgi:TonB family protein
MRGLALTVSALALASSTVAAPGHRHDGTSVGWSYRSAPDKLRGGVELWACRLSSNAVRLGFPYATQPLQLCLRSGQGSDLDIYLDLPRGGQFECLGSDGCDVQASFDGAAPETIGASTPDDGSDDTIFLSDEASVLAKLKAAKRVVFEITFYQAGDQQLIFDVAGLRWEGSNTAASASTAPLAPPPTNADFDITTPDWVRQPDSDDFARYYPDRAQRMAVSGHTSLHCVANANGTIGDCTVLSESPADQGFGDASLKLSKLFKLNPAMPDGKSVEGGRVILSLDFRPPTD